MITTLSSDDDGPTLADLVAIEHEWPLIEAEMDLLPQRSSSCAPTAADRAGLASAASR